MPFTTHQIENIHQGTARYRCKLCQQTWTKQPRPACPGVPVLGVADPRYKTMTALAKERKYPPDLERPDAAYRILNAPYYNWLYDERKAIARPLTTGQQSAIEKRRATMRAKYGCRLCDVWYTAKDQADFKHGVCIGCRSHAQFWNELISWAVEVVEARALVLDLVTSPAERPLDHQGKLPNGYIKAPGREHWDAAMKTYFDWTAYQIAGYSALDIVTGEPVYEVERIKTEKNYQELRYLLTPALGALSSPPALVATGRFSLDVAYRALGIDTRSRSYGRDRKTPFELSPGLDILSMYGRLYQGRAWHSFTPFDKDGQERGVTEREYLAWLSDLMGVPGAEYETPGQLARRIILHLAGQEPLTIEKPDTVPLIIDTH